jgi:hypothetical protein
MTGRIAVLEKLGSGEFLTRVLAKKENLEQ